MFKDGDVRKCLSEEQCLAKDGFHVERNSHSCVSEQLCSEQTYVTADGSCLTEEQCLQQGGYVYD